MKIFKFLQVKFIVLFEYIISGFLVGTLVGLTGVGGGSLMTPLLVLFFKFPTAVAVGTDLLYAAITKSAGAISHHKLGNVDWKIVKNLLFGSLPASYLVTHHLKEIDLYSLQNVEIINTSLGIALFLTSIAVLFQPIIVKKSVKQKLKTNRFFCKHIFPQLQHTCMEIHKVIFKKSLKKP